MTTEEALRKATLNPKLLLSLCRDMLLAESQEDMREGIDRAIKLLLPDSKPKSMSKSELIEALDNADADSLWSEDIKKKFDSRFWMMISQEEEDSYIEVLYKGENEDKVEPAHFIHKRVLLRVIKTFIEENYPPK